MQILKFGGSSLANAAAIQHVARLVREHASQNETVLVCSACAGITDHLARAAMLASAGSAEQALTEVGATCSQHDALFASLALESTAAKSADGPRVRAGLDDLDFDLLSRVFGVQPAKITPAWIDAVLSYGERASVRLVAAALRRTGVQAEAVDATRFVVTTAEFGNAAPLREETRRRAHKILLPLLAKGIIPVVTGFIGATLAGEITTLGRNSSDFSAAIVADALDAEEVWIWTDVDGVYDRDPAASAVGEQDFTLLAEMSYDEALHLAQNGAKVLHPKTIAPLREKNIALRIRNTFRPEHSGTRIGPIAPGAAPEIEWDAAR